MEKIDPTVALKYDKGLKVRLVIAPVEPIEGLLRVLMYGARNTRFAVTAALKFILILD